jgi:hypothetical protein
MEKKKLLFAGAAAIMVVGLLAVANATEQAAADTKERGPPCGGMRGGPGHGGDMSPLKDLGLSENATMDQIDDAMWQKQLKDLGLTEASTLKEYRAAMEARMKTMHEERQATLKEKLGLSADATDKEVMDALKKWQDDNKDLFGGPGGMPGFMRGPDGMPQAGLGHGPEAMFGPGPMTGDGGPQQ